MDGGATPVKAHALSPTRWVFFWRHDAESAVLAQVRLREARSAREPLDGAGIRVMAEHWLGQVPAPLQPGSPAVWNRIDRRARPPVPFTLKLALAALAVLAAACLWLALGLAPQAQRQHTDMQRERAHFAELSDKSLASNLGATLGHGDYGEVQDVLARHASLGLFDAAVVVNARGQVVAHAGPAPAPAMGEPLPPPWRASENAALRKLPLRMGEQQIGELMLQPPQGGVQAPASTPSPWLQLQIGGWSGAVLAALGGALLAWQMRQRQAAGQGPAR
jgi:hypothetical protein